MMSECESYTPLNIPAPKGGEESMQEQHAVKPGWPCLEIHSARHNWVEFSLPCSVKAADQVNEFLVWVFAELTEDVRDSVRIVLRELLMNAIEWGGKSDVSKRVRVAILHGRRALVCRISDPGNGFRMENLRHSAISNPDDKPFNHMSVREQMGLRPGGYGLTIVTSGVDELIYNDAGNEVVFMKYIDRAADSAPAQSNQ